MTTETSGPVRIFVSRAGHSTKLRLRDNRNNPNPIDFLQPGPDMETDANKGDLVIWELDPKSLPPNPEPGYFPIESLENVKPSLPPDGAQYQQSVQVLNGDPVKAGSTFVTYVPDPSAGPGKKGNYKIEYKVPGDPTTYTHDPKIALNS